jgi:hypothetical protein
MSNQAKVILIDENGKKTEYTKYVLFGIDEYERVNESIMKVTVRDLVYFEKLLDARTSISLCDQVREMDYLNGIKNKYQK